MGGRGTKKERYVLYYPEGDLGKGRKRHGHATRRRLNAHTRKSNCPGKHKTHTYKNYTVSKPYLIHILLG